MKDLDQRARPRHARRANPGGEGDLPAVRRLEGDDRLPHRLLGAVRRAPPTAPGASRRRPPRARAATRREPCRDCPAALRFADLTGPEGGHQHHRHHQEQQAQPGWHQVMMPTGGTDRTGGPLIAPRRVARGRLGRRPISGRPGRAGRRNQHRAQHPPGPAGPRPVADPGLHRRADLGHHRRSVRPGSATARRCGTRRRPASRSTSPASMYRSTSASSPARNAMNACR